VENRNNEAENDQTSLKLCSMDAFRNSPSTSQMMAISSDDSVSKLQQQRKTRISQPRNAAELVTERTARIRAQAPRRRSLSVKSQRI
jgi:hypothetical protein